MPKTTNPQQGQQEAKRRLKLPKKFKFDRAKAGTVLDIAVAVTDRLIEGAEVDDALEAELSERAVARYEPHLRAAFERYGVPIEQDAPITVDTLLGAIKLKTGLEIEELSVDGVTSAVDGEVSRRVSSLLGVEIDSMMVLDKVKEALVKSAVEAVASGRATRLISKAIIRRIRSGATWSQQGVPTDDRKTILNREYQRRWRKKYKQVWLSS